MTGTTQLVLLFLLLLLRLLFFLRVSVRFPHSPVNFLCYFFFSFVESRRGVGVYLCNYTKSQNVFVNREKSIFLSPNCHDQKEIIGEFHFSNVNCFTINSCNQRRRVLRPLQYKVVLNNSFLAFLCLAPRLVHLPVFSNCQFFVRFPTVSGCRGIRVLDGRNGIPSTFSSPPDLFSSSSPMINYRFKRDRDLSPDSRHHFTM